MGAVQVGKTVTAQGVAKTLLSRAEKIARVKAWGASMPEKARTEYMLGEKFDSLSDRQQELISEAFTELENDEYSTPTSIASDDFIWKASSIDIDQLVG
jgi:hypothetical protein